MIIFELCLCNCAEYELYEAPWQGPFFTSEGLPTDQWREVEESLSQLSAQEEEKSLIRRKYPSCNSHYDQDDGKAEVWCTERRLDSYRLFFVLCIDLQYHRSLLTVVLVPYLILFQ